jgi:hypothetical protein
VIKWDTWEWEVVFLFVLSGEVSVKYFESKVAVDFYGGENAWSETTPLHRAFILGVWLRDGRWLPLSLSFSF